MALMLNDFSTIPDNELLGVNMVIGHSILL